MRRLSNAVLSVVLLVVLLGLAGCADDGKQASSSTSSSTRRATSSTSTEPCSFAGTTASQRRDPATQTTFLLTNVTVASAGCLDTITFDFEPQGPASEPPYRLEYRDGPFAQSGSGDPVTVPGAAFFVVRFEPAAIADLTREGAPATYTGPHEIVATGTQYVKGLSLYDAFEGVVGWVVGLDAEHPLRVDETSSPARLVVTVGP